MAVDDLRSGTWVTYVAGRATSVRIRRCRLEVVAGPDAGLVRDFEEPLIRVGARGGNHLQLGDSRVSGTHCEIRLDERGYRVCDLDSTNGTFVAGLRINDVYIAPGSTISLGSSKVCFQPLDASVEVALATGEHRGGLIGRSVKMRELFARLDKLAPSDATVLITGETGVGKELVADALHTGSRRKDGPFEVLDCSTIPESLIETHLFGHERGAFTGATRAFPGVFERADKGTVFLDEVGELPLAMQPKLLRVLEGRQVRRVGSTQARSVDIRILAATNRDLAVEVNRGRFREDLYYRLAVAQLHVPPLRERRDDMALLIEHILAETPGGPEHPIAAETIDLMMRHDWPGNVRELRNVIERAVVLRDPYMSRGRGGATGPDRDGGDASSGVADEDRDTDDSFAVTVDTQEPYKLAKQAVIHEFERRYLHLLLQQHEGNISRAARAAGVDRMSIHKMLNRLKLNNPGRR